MTTLALDLGTKTGYAIGTPDLVISGTQEFATNRFSGGGMRFLKFRHWLKQLYEARKFDRVYFEEVRRHLGVDAAHVYGGLMAVLTEFCEERKIAYEGVPVGTIKKHATGAGNASKTEMIEAARARGYNPKDDNEADALAILDWALQQQLFS
jgi:Holliday junction resolvasome RuvABC endonuclease subunit